MPADDVTLIANFTTGFIWRIDTTENPAGLTYAFQANNPDGLVVDWGDGNSTTVNESGSNNVEISHTYDSHGEYVVSVRGGGYSCDHWRTL